MCAQIPGAPQLIGADDSNGRYRRGARGWPIARSAMSENLMIAIFLEAWLQSSPWPNRLDSRHRILAQFAAINRVADALRRAADGYAPSAHPRPLAQAGYPNGGELAIH